MYICIVWKSRMSLMYLMYVFEIYVFEYEHSCHPNLFLEPFAQLMKT